jgi:thiazole/oxazole-forming peptide maturase SagD family component
VAERDALMTLWWIHRPAPRIDLGGPQIPYSVAERVRRLRQAGFEPELYDITTEIDIPTVLCVLKAPRYPHLVISAATHSAAGRACAKALDEVITGRFALQPFRADTEVRSDIARTNEQTRSHVRGVLQHARLYASDACAPALDFLSQPGAGATSYASFSARSITPPTDLNSLSQLAASLERRAAITILWTDVTCPEVAAFGSVVRVIVPELVPLSFDDDVRWLATERLLARSGVKNASKAAFFADPHPFD